MNKFLSLLTYLFTFSISLITANYYQKKYKNITLIKKFIWFLIIMGPPIFISAIRSNVGTDYPAYVRWFNNINYSNSFSIYGREPLYFLLNKLAFYLFRNPWGIFFLSSFLIHFFIFYGLDYFKNKISISFGLFIYYSFHFSTGLNIMRQMIAISIVFYALRFIYNKKIIKYMTLIIIASLFHNTALICLFFYFVVDISIKGLNSFKTFIYYISIILSPLIVVMLLKLIIKLDYFSNYYNYLFSEIDFGIGFLLFILPVIIPIFIFKKSIVSVDRNFESIINLLLLNLPFQYVGYLIDWGGRMANYTNTFYYISIPFLIASVKIKSNKILLKAYYIFFFVFYYFYFFVFNNFGETYPYLSIFN